jgi:biotin transport system substrate-specific component
MIYVLNPTLQNNIIVRLIGIFGFAALTTLGAKINVLTEPVPITLQVLAVLLAGFVLGAEDGFASQMAYLAGLAVGLPLDARSLGSAVFAGPTIGYILAFPFAAAMVGLLAEKQNFLLRWVAGLLAVAFVYAVGTAYLKTYLGSSWQTAYDLGVKQFIVYDIAKALIAAGGGEGLRRWWQ